MLIVRLPGTFTISINYSMLRKLMKICLEMMALPVITLTLLIIETWRPWLVPKKGLHFSRSLFKIYSDSLQEKQSICICSIPLFGSGIITRLSITFTILVFRKAPFSATRGWSHLKLVTLLFIFFSWILTKLYYLEEINEKLSIIHKVYEDLADISICTPLMVYSPHIIEGFMERWPIEATDFKHPSKIHFMAEAFEVDFFYWSDLLYINKHFIFQISVHNYLALSENKPFLLTLPHIRLDANINAMLSNSQIHQLEGFWLTEYFCDFRSRDIESWHSEWLVGFTVQNKNPWRSCCPFGLPQHASQTISVEMSNQNIHPVIFEESWIDHNVI